MEFASFLNKLSKNKFIKPIIEYFNDKYNFFNDISATFNSDSNGKRSDYEKNCAFYKLIINFLLIILLLLSILYIIVYIFYSNYYSTNALLKEVFSKQLRLRDIPEFYQIKNILYINDILSFDLSLIMLMIAAFSVISCCYYLNNEKQFKPNKIDFKGEFKLIIIFCILIIISGFIYYSINYNNLIDLSKRNNLLITFFYKNINRDYIVSENLCNYNKKKDILDGDFKLNKCNDIELNFSIESLYRYVKNIMNEIYNEDSDMNINKFKSLKDNKGVFYKDKLSTAFFTFSLMYYYTSNNLYDEAKELFAKNNRSINPMLDLNYESVLLNRPDLSYNNYLMRTAFNNNKDIYFFVYNEYYNISSDIQNLIVDIYNICKYRMISIYTYYNFVLFMMLVIIIYYLTTKILNKKQ